MKKILISLFSFLLLIPYVPAAASSSSDIRTATISIPVSTGLIGTAYSAKQFNLNLPSGVKTSSIISNTLQYRGTNSLSSIQLAANSIEVKLAGVANTKSVNVTGYMNGYYPFSTAIGNSIWRYSDGRTWQINDYNHNTDRNYSYDKPATDSNMPSKIVPRVRVNADSQLSTLGRSWKTDSMEIVPEEYVQENTIEVNFGDKSSWIDEVKMKNGKIITSYTIPISPNDPEVTWDNVTANATMPIIQHVQGRFYKAKVEYVYKATAKIPTYSYGGTVTFDYKLPTEPTLTGEVSLIDPNPNPIQYSGDKVPVKISVKGLLSSFSDTSNIQEWTFYAKETGNDASLLQKKDPAKILSSQKTFDFFIPKIKASEPRYTQNYTLTVTVRFNQPIITSEGTITSLSETMNISASTFNSPGPTPGATPQPAAEKPPFARITAPTKVKAGTSFIVSGANSFDTDGTIVGYAWEHPNANLALYGKTSDTSYGLDQIGTTQTVTLTVTDNSGLTGTTSQDIQVVAPMPNPKIAVSGTLKQNRKIVLHNATLVSSEDFPLAQTETKFSIEFLEGDRSDKDIKYNGSLNGTDDVEFLVKNYGQYRISLYVENTAGYGASTSKTIMISPDEAPAPYISIPSGIYRDPSDGNRAKVVLDDLSISPDFDYLAHRLWQYRYDSDNDGNFSEENWVVASDANIDRLSLYLTEVGRYEIKLTVTEEFGQPTIDSFVTVSDRRSANTDTQASIEKIITVYNRKPVTDWTW